MRCRAQRAERFGLNKPSEEDAKKAERAKRFAAPAECVQLPPAPCCWSRVNLALWFTGLGARSPEEEARRKARAERFGIKEILDDRAAN